MGMARSTYYDEPSSHADDAAIVAAMIAICDEFEAYGYRRVGAALRHRGMVVNHKKIRRLMREHGLQPKRRRRFVATTDSDHDGPIFPDLARDRMVDGPNQLWVADITYVAIASRLRLYGRHPRCLVAPGRRLCDQPLDRCAADRCGAEGRDPSADSRRRAASTTRIADRNMRLRLYRSLLADHGLVGSMGRRGNPYDNAKAESFMKTLKVEAVYLMAYETFEDVAADLPRFIDEVYNPASQHPSVYAIEGKRFC